VSYASRAVSKISIKNERRRYIGILSTTKAYKRIPVYAVPRLGYITATSGRFFSTNRSGNTEGPGDDEGRQPRQGAGREGSDNEYSTHQSLPATVVVPEVWPHLPLIAVNRNPVFPRFIKLIEVSEMLTNDCC
jgi:hypothetical protein